MSVSKATPKQRNYHAMLQFPPHK